MIDKTYSQNQNKNYKSKDFEDYLYFNLGAEIGGASEEALVYGIFVNAACYGITGTYHYRKFLAASANEDHNVSENSGSIGYQCNVSPVFKVSFSAGLGQAKFECHNAAGNGCMDYINQKLLCCPINADLFLVPRKGYFGLGLNFFSNLNERKNIYGATINLRLFFVKPER